MAMDVKIRKMVREDISSVYNLGLQQFKGEYWFTRRFISQTAERPGHEYVACRGKEIVGAIMVETLDRPKMWIFFFVVDKNFRRKGIGSQLLGVIEKKRSKDFPLLFVDVGVNDKEAHSFYKKNGFKRQAKIDTWFGQDEPGIIYSKNFFKQNDQPNELHRTV